MLSLRSLPRSITYYVKQSQLHTSVKVLAANESSSSSDSSDSDSDKEKQVKKKDEKQVKQQKEEKSDEFLSASKTNDRLNALLLKITETSAKKSKEAETLKKTSADSPDTPSLNVALKSRKDRFKKPDSQQAKKQPPIEEQIAGAAKDVAKTLGGDTQKTELELLSQILNLEPKESETKETKDKSEVSEKASAEPINLNSLLSGMKVDVNPKMMSFEEKRKKKAQGLKQHLSEPSVTTSLLNKKILSREPSSTAEGSHPELKSSFTPLDIFKNISEDRQQNVPELATWARMQKREMKMSTLMTPQNVFQELILWTEQGKLWHFPINNEQGLEEEEKVHFSEHVFMERHLKSWCPKKGPIRHFMELVCTGLSKNPYMTVEEKVGHIKWYQEYFESKKDLLLEVGALENKAPTQEKQIEA